MNAQIPTRGIMLTADYGDSKSYTIDCDCQAKEHQVNMWIDLDVDLDVDDQVKMTFHVTTTTPFWKDGFSRFKAAWDILVHGYREDQHTLLLNKQAALNVANTIIDVVKELEKHD